jgi:hypothetical protein
MLISTIARYETWVSLGAATVVNATAIPARSIGVATDKVLIATTLANASAFGLHDIGPVPPNQLTATTVANVNAFGTPAVAGPSSGSYANPGGSGNRTANITVSTTLTGGRVDVVANTVNGDFAASVFGGFWAGDQAAAGLEINWNLSSYGSKKIDRFKWHQGGSETHGVWQPQYSANGSTWINSGVTVTLGGATMTEYILASAAAGQWFRLLGVSGTFNSNPWITEVEFSITA